MNEFFTGSSKANFKDLKLLDGTTGILYGGVACTCSSTANQAICAFIFATTF
jgi:hypothetical protein